jgi:hypothetical protein
LGREYFEGDISKMKKSLFEICCREDETQNEEESEDPNETQHDEESEDPNETQHEEESEDLNEMKRTCSPNKLFEWVCDNYLVYDPDKVFDDFDIEKGARDSYQVGDYCVRFDTLYGRYKNGGGKCSITKVGRELTKNNIFSVQRRVKGKTLTYRVGVNMKALD